MRLTLVALAALSLAACSKHTDPNAAAAGQEAQSAAADAGAAAADATANAANTVAAGASSAADATGSAMDTASGGNPAVKDTHRQDHPMAAGANSFTMGEARKHVEHAGYAQVTDLRQDDAGVWHGRAMKDGHTVAVAVDFKGDVTAQ
jgi:hypothetical protein